MHDRVAVQEPRATSDLSLPFRASALAASAAGLLSRQTLLVLLAVFVLLTGGTAYAQDTVESDRAALVAFYNATDGPNWTNNTNWLSDETLSEWYGVTTDATGRVTVLDLPVNELTGEIPVEMGNLTNLRELILSLNELTGEIPAELSHLTQLMLLDLGGNQLTGEVPPELAQLSQLENLWLGRNQLTGEIPPELAQLSQLTNLNLFSNQLTGPIPVELGQLSQLGWLDLGRNQLTGEIPPELAQLSQLTDLRLWDNQLTGPIPVELGQLSQLGWLDLGRNQLTGEIPPELAQLSQLTDLRLWDNQLTGPIPVELGQLSQLGWLDLGRNQLTGEIPPELAQLSQLRYLRLWYNQLTGPIPVELGQLSQLKWLHLWGNQLTGEIPPELAQLSQLTGLNLWGNQLTGEIPPELAQLSQLTGLNLGRNQLTGEIPPELAQLSQLTGLNLWGNQLTGEIPTELGQLSQLRYLRLWDNQLTGPIPVELAQLSQLRYLYLFGNELTGEIPVELGQLSQLQWLYLYDNQLTGEIPAELAQLTQLQRLYLYDNQLTGEIPAELAQLTQLQHLYFHGNQLTGEIPSWLVNLTELRELSLWSNELTGTIPPEVAPAQDRAALRVLYLQTGGANWTNRTSWLRTSAPISEWYGVTTDANGRVTSLSLSANGLNGTIGAELGVLTRLTGLYLNDNQLTGTIPPELENLTQLQVFDIRNTGLCVTADSELHTWIATIQDFQGTATCTDQLTLDFTHFANGDDTTSDLVFVNLSTEPVRPAIYFYDTEGNPIAAESVVDITGDLEISEDGGLTVLTEMEPLGELTIATHGQGDLVSGSVKVASEGLIGGMLRFNLPHIGEAVVEASPPVSDALFVVRRQEGGITTGVAIHNLEEEPMEVVCELMREGVLRDAVSIPLEANGQTSWLLDQAFPAADTSDFAGSVRCDAPGRRRFSAVALEVDPGARVFITLPLFPVDRGGGGPEAALDFAHFANGDGTTSDLVFVNMKTQPSGPAPIPFHTAIPPIRPAIYFYDTEGNPIAAESVVDLTGDLVIQEDGGLTVLTEMEPLGVLTVSTHGQGPLVSGSVRVLSNGPIGGMLRYDLPHIGEAVVGASQPVSDAIFAVRRREEGITTGVALHNLESSPALVHCDLMREGVLRDAASFPLEANGQTSWLIDQAFPAAATSDFTGSVRCDAVGEGRFSAVALEMDPGTRVFTTLPLVPLEKRMPQE